MDDDPTFRRLARLLLADLGFVVVAEAGSVADALSTALRVKPSRVLVNVELPDGDGFELAGRLSAMTWSPRSSRRRRTAVRSQPWLRSGAS